MTDLDDNELDNALDDAYKDWKYYISEIEMYKEDKFSFLEELTTAMVMEKSYRNKIMYYLIFKNNDDIKNIKTDIKNTTIQFDNLVKEQQKLRMNIKKLQNELEEIINTECEKNENEIKMLFEDFISKKSEQKNKKMKMQ